MLREAEESAFLPPQAARCFAPQGERILRRASLAQDDTQRAFRALPSLPGLPGGKDLAKMAYF